MKDKKKTTNHFGDGAKPKPSDVKEATQAAYGQRPYVDPNTGIAGADPAAMANAAASGNSLWSYLPGFPARFNEANSMFIGSKEAIPNSIVNMASSTPAGQMPVYQPVITLTLPDIKVDSQLTTDSAEWDRMLDYKTQAVFNSTVQNLTLDMNSATSASGSN